MTSRRVLTINFGYPSRSNPARFLFTHEQAKALSRHGAYVEALDLSGTSATPSRELYEGVPVSRLSLPRSFARSPTKTASAVALARTWIRNAVMEKRFDLVLLSFLNHKYGPLWSSVAAGGARIAFTVHGVDVMWQHERLPYRWVKAELARRAKHIFAVSDETGRLARSILPEPTRSKVIVIPNGVDRPKLDAATDQDRDQLRSALNWPHGCPVVLSVANLVPRKGLDILIRAHALLRDRGQDLLHVIVGRGPEREALEDLTHQLRLQDRTRFIGEVLSDETLARAMATCDVFALASRTTYDPPGMEGFGVVYAEASYLGRPVVGGASGGVPSVVDSGRTGILVDPEGKDAPVRFAHALGRLLASSELREQMGRAARAQAEERFDWDLNAQRVLRHTRPS